MAHEVFISYAKEDLRTVEIVCQALEAEGIGCWYAPRNVPKGSVFGDAIVTAISESRLMLLILSSHALDSRFVMRECNCADDEDVTILPLRIEDVRPSGGLKLYIGSLQWLDALTPPFESHLEPLITSVRTNLQKEAEHKRALEEAARTRAKEEEEARRKKLEEEAARRAEEERQRKEEEARQRAEAEKRQSEEQLQRKAQLRKDKEEELPMSEAILAEQHAAEAGPGRSEEAQGMAQRLDDWMQYIFSLNINWVMVIAALLLVGCAFFGALFVEGPSRLGNYNRQTTTAQPSPAATSPTPPQVVSKSTGMELVLIPAGEFMMGSTDEEAQAAYESYRQYVKDAKPERWNAEKPKHLVRFSQPFYMGEYEVTQGQWRAVMGTTLRQQRDKNIVDSLLGEIYSFYPILYGEGDNYPMYYVSWDEAQAFIQKLNELDGIYKYRLPSEAEWEYTARARTTGDHADNLGALAWYGDNSGREWNMLAIRGDVTLNYSEYEEKLRANENSTHEVGRKQPNNFGLYDMLGNVKEWCQDLYHPNYKGAPQDGSVWEKGGQKTVRVERGGSWRDTVDECRFAWRLGFLQRDGFDSVGFRVVAGAR